jgi:DNA-binding NtrC family response regulator
VESEVGKGSSFFVEIPLKIHDAEDSTSPPPTAKSNQLRCLVAEDIEMKQLLFKKTLESLDIFTDFSENVEDFLQKLSENHFDMIIVDFNKDGFSMESIENVIHSSPQQSLALLTNSSGIKTINGKIQTYLITDPINKKELENIKEEILG